MTFVEHLTNVNAINNNLTSNSFNNFVGNININTINLNNINNQQNNLISINTSNQVNSNDIFQDEDLYDNEIEISSDNENKIE